MNQNLYYKKIAVRHGTNVADTDFWESKSCPVPSYGSWPVPEIIKNELFDYVEHLLANGVECLSSDVAANVKEAYESDNMEVVLLVEHVKEWFLDSAYNSYNPINPSDSFKHLGTTLFYVIKLA